MVIEMDLHVVGLVQRSLKPSKVWAIKTNDRSSHELLRHMYTSSCNFKYYDFNYN